MALSNPNLSSTTLTGKVEYLFENNLIPYEDAIVFMEKKVNEIYYGRANECIWFLEHPSLYTAGTSANSADLIDKEKFNVYQTGRGGQFTYHGPGQRVVYVMLDLRQRRKDVRAFVCALENWIIQALATFNITALRRRGRVGIWIDCGDGREEKIGAIGIRIRRWITFHGISINVETNLSHFDAIVPCGIADDKLGVTSMSKLGLPVTMADLDVALIATFKEIFGD